MGTEGSKPKPQGKRVAQWKADFPDYVKEAEYIIRLQELLFNLTSESFDESITISVEKYLLNSDSINSYADNLILASTYRPHNSELLAKLFSSITQKVPALKESLLKRIFNPLPDQPSYPIYNWGHLRFVKFCLKNNSIEPIEICKLVRDVLISYSEFVNFIMFLFAYFCKEIDLYDHSLYSEIFDYYSYQLSQNRPVNALLTDFMNNLTNYQESDYKLLTEMIEWGYAPGSVEYSILHEDKLPSEMVDFSIIVEPTLFAQCPIMQNSRPSLIQFCAYHGLENCFLALFGNEKIDRKTADFACAGGSSSIIEILSKYEKENENVNEKEKIVDFSQNCLKMAALHHRYDIFEWLSKKYEDEIQDSIYNCVKSNNIKSLLHCFDNGVDVDMPDDYNLKPLHYAAMSGSFEAVHLLTGQPDVEACEKGKEGMTPLLYASQFGYKNITSFLLTKCKNVSIKEESDGNLNALHYAAMKGHIEIVPFLLSLNCDPNYAASNFSTALHFAAQYGHAEIARILLGVKKIDVNARNKMSCTPLHLACMNNYPKVVRVLLGHPKIDVNVVNSGSKTPLIIAAEKESIEIVNLLLNKKGIMRNIEDRNAVNFIFLI